MSTVSTPLADPSPVLRTLSPALRNLERSLRGWLDGPHRYPLSTMNRATLEGFSTDLHRQSEALDVDRPHLVVMLMGGTGVGKSTLLNALAGGSIAPASFQRPTTRDPVVYYHESVRTDRLDPALRHCRLVAHDRRELEQKILVDTPDVDSNDLSNREKLIRLLPIADVVLYVGSQEKYHDEIVYELFRQQRKRRAFAFVLNKWDRCSNNGTTGVRPDEDLRRDLENEGFISPLLFRTCAQLWLDRTDVNGPPGNLPEGEQFRELVAWLESGLTRLEIEAIKARGVSQLLQGVQEALREAAPPELAQIASAVRTAWQKPLAEEATAIGDVLVNTLEPFQIEIEHHFALEGQRRFRGLMAWYLQLGTRARYVSSSLREKIPFVTRSKQSSEKVPTWDLSLFTSACTDVAANKQLDARGKALVNRLLVEADGQGFPLKVLTEPVEAQSHIDWRQRWSVALADVLQDVERQLTRPTGTRRVIQGLLVFFADWAPGVALIAAAGSLLWKVFNPMGKQDGYNVGWIDVLLIGIIPLVVLVILHMLSHMLLPLRWNSIRDQFHRQLEERVRMELETGYLEVPNQVAGQLREERQQVERLVNETGEVAAWLARREQSASIAGLYGTT